MTPFREPTRPRAGVLFVFALSLVVIASPVRALWAQPSLPWWLPFLVWGVVVVAGGLASAWWARSGRH